MDARANGDYLNGLAMTANVVAPDGGVNNLALQQVAPGQYEADFFPTQDGAYFIRVAGVSPDGESVVGQTSGWVLGYSPEYQQFAAEPERLAAVAAVGNGRDVTEVGTVVFAHDLAGEATTRPIWPWLVLTAVLLLPVDIAVRRLVITRRDWERAWAATFGRWRPEPVRPAAKTEQVSRLFQAKERATERRLTPTQTTMEAPMSDSVSAPVADGQQEEGGERPLKEPSSAAAPASGSLASRLLEKKRQAPPGAEK